MNEEWRLVINGDYEISNMGNARRATPGQRTYVGRPLSPIIMKVGYLEIRPVVGGRNTQRYVHDLVALAFLGPKPKGQTVNHIDGDKTNNRASNLEYVSHAENMAHAGRTGLMVRGMAHPGSKLDDEAVRLIRQDRERGGSFSQIAKKYYLSTATVFKIVNRTSWAHVT